MAYSYDPYTNWLGIPPTDRPITYYRLLGIKLFENNPAAISAAAEQRVQQLRAAVRVTNSPDFQRILKEIGVARDCLLHPESKQRYDNQLQQRLGGATSSQPTSQPISSREIGSPVPENAAPTAVVLPRGIAGSVNVPHVAPLPALPPAAEEAMDAILLEEPELPLATYNSPPWAVSTAHSRGAVAGAGTVSQQPRVAPPPKSGKRRLIFVLSGAVAAIALGVVLRLTILSSPTESDSVASIPPTSHVQTDAGVVEHVPPPAAPVPVVPTPTAVVERPVPPVVPKVRQPEPSRQAVVAGPVPQPAAMEARPLRLLPPMDPTVVVGRTYSQQFQVEFPAYWKGVAKFSLEGELPSGAAIDAVRGRMNWTPTAEQANKVFRMKVRVAAPGGYVDEQTLTANVISPPQLPQTASSEMKYVPALLNVEALPFVLQGRDMRLPPGKGILRPLLRLGPHLEKTYLNKVQLSASGRYLAVCDFSQVYLWIITQEDRPRDGTDVSWTARHHRTLRLDDSTPDRGNDSRNRSRTSASSKRPVVAIKFSPDEQKLAVASDDGQTRVWDTNSGGEVQQFRVFSSHTGDGNYLRDVLFLPDNNTLVAVCSSYPLTKWNVKTGERIGDFPFSGEEQRKLLLSRDGGRLFIVKSKTFSALDLLATPWKEQWEANVRKEGHRYGFGPAELSPDGRMLASGDGWGILTFWDTASGHALRTMQAHTDSLHQLAWLGNGEVLATSSGNGNRGSCFLWNAATMTRMGEVTGHQGLVRGMSVSADGQLFATAGQDDCSAIVWRYELLDSPESVPSVAREQTSERPSTALARRPGQTCRIRPLVDPVVIAGRTYKQQVQVDGPAGTVMYVLEPGAPSGAAIDPVTGLLSWNVSQEQVNQRYTITVRATLPDGSTDFREMFASVIQANEKFPTDVAGQQILWQTVSDAPLEWNMEVAGGREKLKCALRPRLRLGPLPENAWINDIEISHSGSLVAASLGGEILLWKLESVAASDPSPAGALSVAGTKMLIGHRERMNMGSTVNAVRFTPDDSRLISAGNDGTIRVWDTATGAALRVLGPQNERIRDLAILPDGNHVLSADNTGELKLWNIATGARAGQVRLFRSRAQRCFLSPRGDRLAILDENFKVLLCSVRDRGFSSAHNLNLEAERGPDEPVSEDYRAMSVCFTRDGARFITADNVETFSVWDVQQEKRLHTVQGHAHESIHWMSFLGKGEVLATAGSGGIVGTAFLWNAATRERLATISGHQKPITGMAVSGDGRRLATLAGQERSVMIWQYESQASQVAR